MKRTAYLTGAVFLAVSAGFGATMLVDGPVNSTNSWGGSLTRDENYTLNAAGTVGAADDFTLMATANNVLVVANGREASLVMDGGSFNVAGKLYLGHDGTGRPGNLYLSGGTLTTGGDFGVARFRSNTVATVNMSGGTLDVGNHILIGHANDGETAAFHYTGGTIRAADQFQLMDGVFSFRLGCEPVICMQRIGSDQSEMALTFGPGYAHIAGTVNRLIESGSNYGPFHLQTDAGLMEMTNGAQVNVSGYPFEISESGTLLAVTALQSTNAPAVSAMTPSAAAGQTLVISGEKLDGASLHVETDSGSFDLDPWMSKPNRMLAVLPPNMQPSVLRIRPVRDALYGEPFFVNRAEAWWSVPSRINAADGTAVAVKLVGRNLMLDGFSPVVHLSGSGVDQDLSTTALGPYALVATLPAGLAPGAYQLTAHNGSGGESGWSKPVEITVEAGIATGGLPEFSVAAYGAVADDGIDDLAALSNAVAAADAAGGGSVLLGQGTYHLSAGLTLPENVHLSGKGMGGWSGLDLESAALSGSFSELRPPEGVTNLAELVRMESPYASLRDLTVFNRHAGTSPGSINDGGIAGQMTQCAVRAYAPDLVFENVRFVLADARPDVAFAAAPQLVLYDAALHIHSPGEANIRVAGCDFRSAAVGLTFDHPQDQHIGTNACVAGTEVVTVSNCTFAGHSGFMYAYTPGSLSYSQDESYGIYNWNARRVAVEHCTFSGASRTNGVCLNRAIFVRNTSVDDLLIAHNTMTNVGVWPAPGSALDQYLTDGGKVNEGEQILFHYRHPYGGYFDVLSAGTDSVTVDPDDPRNAGETDNLGRAPDRRGSRILPMVGNNDHWLLYIAAGRGAGQVRTVTAQQEISGDVQLAVDEPWRVVPDGGSSVLLFAAYRHIIIRGNAIDAGTVHPAVKTGGTQFWLDAVDNIIDGNRYANLSYGTVLNSAFRNPCLWNLVQNTVSSNFSGFTGAGTMQPEFIHHSYYRSNIDAVEDPCATTNSDCHGWYSVGNVFRANSGTATAVGGFSGAHVGDWFSQNSLVELPDAGIMMDVMEFNDFTGVTNGFRYNKTCNDLLLRNNLLSCFGDTHYNKSESGAPSDAVLYVDGGPDDGMQPFGYTRYETNVMVNASIVSEFVSNEVSRVFVSGTSGTGDAPSESGTNVSFVITQDSTLAWNRTAEHYLNVSVDGFGSVSPQSGWFNEGTNLLLTAMPDDWSLFGFWTGAVVSASNPLSFSMDAPKTLTARFTEQQTEFGTLRDLAEQGLNPLSGDPEAMARTDLDGDGYTAAQEAVFGTSDTNALDYAELLTDGVWLEGIGALDRRWLVDHREALTSGTWTLHTNLFGDGFSVPVVPGEKSAFYRLQLAPENAPYLMPAWYSANRIQFHWENHADNIAEQGGAEGWISWLTNVHSVVEASGAKATVAAAKYGAEACWWNSSTGAVLDAAVSNDLVREAVVGDYHNRGLRTICYYRHDIDYAMQDLHPEWLCRDVNGDPEPVARGSGLDWPQAYRMCMNSPFREFVKIRLVELAQRRADGIYFDEIHMPEVCLCDNCKAAYLAEYGVPLPPEGSPAFVAETISECFAEWKAAVHAVDPRIVLAVASSPYAQFDGIHHSEQSARSGTVAKTEFQKCFGGQQHYAAAPIRQMVDANTNYWLPPRDLQEMLCWMIARDVNSGRPPHIWVYKPDTDSEEETLHTAAIVAANGGIAGMSLQPYSTYLPLYQKLFAFNEAVAPFMDNARPYAWALIHVSEELKQSLDAAGGSDPAVNYRTRFEGFYAPVLGAAQALRSSHAPFATVSDTLLKNGGIQPEAEVLVVPDLSACSDELRAAIDAAVRNHSLTLIDLSSFSGSWHLSADLSSLQTQLLSAIGDPPCSVNGPDGFTAAWHLDRDTGNLMACLVRNWDWFWFFGEHDSTWTADVPTPPFQGVEIQLDRPVSAATARDFDGSAPLTPLNTNGISTVPVAQFNICTFVEILTE